MAGDMTRGYDLVIEISLGQVKDSLKALLDQEKGTQIGDAINGALNWAIRDFNYICSIDDVSFCIPDSISGQVQHLSLFDDNLYLKLTFNGDYAILGQIVPIKITLETVIGIDIGPCVSQIPSIQFARLDLKNLFCYYHTTISLNDSGFAGTIRDILNLLGISADDLLQAIIDDLLNVAGTSHEQLDNKLKATLQSKVPFIPLPLIPIYIPDPRSTNPLMLIEADCRTLETAAHEQILTYLFTYGGGTPGDRWAFDNFNKSDIAPGNNAAIIVSFKPYTCRMIKETVKTALNLTGADADTFSKAFHDCKLWKPIVINKDENVTLKELAVQILPPGLVIPFGPTLKDGGILATATITKSGTCYAATGKLTAVILIHHDGNNNIVIDQPLVNVDVDAGVDIWCKIAAAAAGFVILPDPAIDAVVDAIIYEIMGSIVDSLSRNAINGVTDALTAAMSTVTDNVPQIPGVETLLKMVVVDDVTMGYTFNVVRKTKLPSATLLSPVEGAHLTTSPGSKCTTTLKWAAVPGATGYKVEVLFGSTGPGGRLTWANCYQGVVEGTQVTLDFAGANPGMWRVTALDKTGHYWLSVPGSWRTFSWTPALPTPALLSPAEGQHLTAPAGSKCTTTLQWQAVSGATGYLVEVQYAYPGPAGALIWADAYRNTVAGTQLTFDFAGSNPGRWRVTALDPSGWYGSSGPSGWRSFSWAWPLPAPVLLSPAEGIHLKPVGTKRTTVLKWQAVPGATAYLVEVQYGYPGRNGRMIWGAVYNGEVTDTQAIVEFVGMNPGRWRVAALDHTGMRWRSDPSQWRNFVYDA